MWGLIWNVCMWLCTSDVLYTTIQNGDVHFNRLIVNWPIRIKLFDRLIQSVKRFKVTYLLICFSNLSKYFKRFAAWLKWCKIPAINNPTAGLLWPRIWVTLENYPNTELLHLTQTLSCYIWPRGWVTQKLLKHWKNNPPKGSTQHLG